MAGPIFLASDKAATSKHRFVSGADQMGDCGAEGNQVFVSSSLAFYTRKYFTPLVDGDNSGCE